MRSVYLECRMGAAGDMLCAALYELCDEAKQKAYLAKMNALGLKDVRVRALPEEKCGIRGTRMAVSVGTEEEGREDAEEHPAHDAPHAHDAHAHSAPHAHDDAASPGGIAALIGGLDLPEAVRKNALDVYQMLAEAESAVHGAPVELVHFHEVGALDAVADIVGFCLLMDLLGIEAVTVSPVHAGSGQVRTAHGVLPVPAPATARLLTGAPTYSDGTAGELCTPTGAALIRRFALGFGPMPAMTVEKIGYGMGKKNFAAANCVRAFLGEPYGAPAPNDTIAELRCNIDDMTPEAIGFAMEALLAGGVRDVYVEPVFMKKNRPGFVLVCLCGADDADKAAALMLKHTTTLGVRKFLCGRYILDREIEERQTSLGKVRVKRSHGYGVSRVKPEYDDVARAAKEKGLPFEEAYRTILAECEALIE